MTTSERTSRDILISIAMTNEAILAELRHLRAAMGSESRSSVEVKTSTRGVDVTCKAYEGSDITAAGDAAKAEYLRIVADLNNGALAAAINDRAGLKVPT